MPQTDWFRLGTYEEPTDDVKEELDQQDVERLQRLLLLGPLDGGDLFCYNRYCYELMVSKKYSVAWPDMDFNTHPGTMTLSKHLGRASEMNYCMPEHVVQNHEDVAAAGIFDRTTGTWLGHAAKEVYSSSYRFVDNASYVVQSFADDGELMDVTINETDCLEAASDGNVLPGGFWLAGEKYQITRKQVGSHPDNQGNIEWVFANRPNRGVYLRFTYDFIFAAFWRGDPDANGFKCKVYLESFINVLQIRLSVLDWDRVSRWRAWKEGDEQVVSSGVCTTCRRRFFGYKGVELHPSQYFSARDDNGQLVVLNWEDVPAWMGCDVYCQACVDAGAVEPLKAAEAHFTGTHVSKCQTKRLVMTRSSDGVLVAEVHLAGTPFAQCSLTCLEGKNVDYPYTWKGPLCEPGPNKVPMPNQWLQLYYGVQEDADGVGLAENHPAMSAVAIGAEDSEWTEFLKVPPGEEVSHIKTIDCTLCEYKIAATAPRSVEVFARDATDTFWEKWHLEDLESRRRVGPTKVYCRRCALQKGFAKEAKPGEGTNFDVEEKVPNPAATAPKGGAGAAIMMSDAYQGAGTGKDLLASIKKSNKEEKASAAAKQRPRPPTEEEAERRAHERVARLESKLRKSAILHKDLPPPSPVDDDDDGP
mmetsp:Transcript_96048/g.200649  ORF Transcript_96048/g.200649 Transcript_96048/m.200649 type:complete len:643 (-) Transcript_96048:33-1961(-)